MRGLERERRQALTSPAMPSSERPRGHYELGVHARTSHLRLAAAFDELATAI
jgi:hypothetical protein